MNSVDKVVYIDETGRTGRHIFSNGQWNYKQNPYFGLGGICVDYAYKNELNNTICNIIKEFKIQGELKFSNKRAKKISQNLLSSFAEVLANYGGKLYVEVVNQRFCDCQNIVEYLVFPYYDTISIEYNERRIGARLIANYIYQTLNDDVIWKCVSVFDNENYDKGKLFECADLLKDDPIIGEHVKKTIDSIKTLPLSEKNFYPLKDFFKNRTSTFAISPHIDSFNNLINRVNFDFDMSNKIFIHDNENELTDALQKWSKIANIQLSFEKSKNNFVLQLVDFFIGNIVFELQNWTKMSDKPFIKMFNHGEINIVSTIDEQLMIYPYDFDACCIKRLLKQIRIS